MTHPTESAQKTENPEHSLYIFSWHSTLKFEERGPSHKVSKKENKTELLVAHLWPLEDYALCYKYCFPKIPRCGGGNTELLNKNQSSISVFLDPFGLHPVAWTSLFSSYLKAPPPIKGYRKSTLETKKKHFAMMKNHPSVSTTSLAQPTETNCDFRSPAYLSSYWAYPGDLFVVFKHISF